jgi:alpha-glucuronidase
VTKKVVGVFVQIFRAPLLNASAPHQGLLIWRAFVYSHEIIEDRHKASKLKFIPLDGKFRENVIIQVKNGAIDFST